MSLVNDVKAIRRSRKRRSALLMTQGFPPETHAGANRAASLADALQADFDVAVITVQPSYPTPEHHRDQEFPEELATEGLGVHRAGPFHPHRGSAAWRGMRELLMASRLSYRAIPHRCSVVVATSPSLFLGLAGYFTALAKGVPFVWDLRDVTWSLVAEDDRLSHRVRSGARLLRQVARSIARGAALLTVTNSGIAEELVALGVDAERIALIPNGVSAALIDRARDVPPATQNGGPTVAYVGAIGHYQGLSTLLEVAERLPAMRFLVVGDGPEKERLASVVKEKGLSNVQLMGYLPREAVFRVYADSDILFAQLRDMPVLRRATVPSKPFEYMATGRPIVYAGDGITADLLESIGCALIARPEDVESIEDCIRRLVANPGLADELGEAGRAACHEYKREDIMRLAVERIAEIVPRHSEGISERRDVAEGSHEGINGVAVRRDGADALYTLEELPSD